MRSLPEPSAPGLGRAFSALLRRDFVLAFRHRGELLNPLMFYVIVLTLFPLGVGSEPERLREIAAGMIWVAALLSTLLALDGLFRSDFDDGSLEQMMLSPQPVQVLVLAKVLVHWLVTGLPLIVVTPLLALLMNLDPGLLGVLLLSLVLGTPTLSLVGAIGVALTVGIRRGGLLLSLLVLPLYVPVLIFGTAVVEYAAAGLPVVGQLYLLGAMLAAAVTLAPLGVAAALRVSLG